MLQYTGLVCSLLTTVWTCIREQIFVDGPGRQKHPLRLWLNNPLIRCDSHRLVKIFAWPESRFFDTPCWAA